MLRKCVSYHKNPHLSNPFHKTFTHQSAIQHSDDAPAITFTTGNSTFLPAIQHSDDGFHKKLSPSSQPSSAATMAHPSPSDHRKLSLSSQPSSAALMAHPTPGNPLNPPSLINPTLPPEAPHSHHYLLPGIEQPGRRVPVGSDSAGGELILGWRKSALFLKSPLSERQQAASSDFLKTVLAEFRQPRSSPRRSPEPTGTRLPGVRHPPSALHPPPQKKSAPQPIQTTKNALLIPSAYNHTQSPTISIQ